MFVHEEDYKVTAQLTAYGFLHVGTISLTADEIFLFHLTFEDAKKWEKAVYAFVFKDEIVRIGSSKGLLGNRMRDWSRDTTNVLRKINGKEAKKPAGPNWETGGYRDLCRDGEGLIYARQATTVETPVGKFRAYMDEESILINRYKPRLNRHTNR